MIYGIFWVAVLVLVAISAFRAPDKVLEEIRFNRMLLVMIIIKLFTLLER